jgi:putative addiction module killer protein
LLHYVTDSGHDLVRDWLDDLHDSRAAARIVMRIDRMSDGNFGDCKPIQGGIWELRIAYGPGYRVYYAMVGRRCVLMLCGGDKRKQAADIKRAMEYLKDYRRRMGKP